MLTHHEMATLFLVQDARNPEALDPMDLSQLVEHRFVVCDTYGQGGMCPQLTDRGRSLLQAMGRYH
ncbi:hypothetical protein [Cupriavidus sp. CP313]